jgi:maltoporin
MARLGGFVTEGLAIGIEGNTELVANASENLASTAISGLKDAIKAATNLTDLGIDLNPTITPVLDLSNIEAGSTQLDNLTNGWNNVGISTSSTLASSAANSFNKTSMAKASMALETQNGLSLLKSAINSLESRESDEKLDTIVGMMTEFMPLIGQGQVVLDTGATVGALAPRMDAELGRRASMRGRHV